MPEKGGRDFPNVHISPHPSITDLQRDCLTSAGMRARNDCGALELALMRGFQAGYQQAILDNETGGMVVDRALDWRRSIDSDLPPIAMGKRQSG